MKGEGITSLKPSSVTPRTKPRCSLGGQTLSSGCSQLKKRGTENFTAPGVFIYFLMFRYYFKAVHLIAKIADVAKMDNILVQNTPAIQTHLDNSSCTLETLTVSGGNAAYLLFFLPTLPRNPQSHRRCELRLLPSLFRLSSSSSSSSSSATAVFLSVRQQLTALQSFLHLFTCAPSLQLFGFLL